MDKFTELEIALLFLTASCGVILGIANIRVWRILSEDAWSITRCTILCGYWLLALCSFLVVL